MKDMYSPFVTSNFIVGRGSIKFISQLNKKRAVVIYDGRIMSDATKEQLLTLVSENGGECRFIADIRNEPYFSDIVKAADDMNEFNPDLIIAIGGGSVLDTAKAMHLFYEYPDMSVEDSLIPYNLPELGKKAIMVAIPTTSGTGSETTSAAVFIDHETKAKRLMLSNELIPAYAILDADFTDTLPKSVASHTGMDALTHALEASVCVTASPMVVSIAISAALDILENLKISVLGNEDEKLSAREACHVAASLSGVAITNSCAGLAHGFDQPGAYFDLPHGMVCGLLLPYTTAFASPHPSYAKLAKRLGLKGDSEKELCQNLVDYLVNFNKAIGIPLSFAEAGIDEEIFFDKLEDFATLAISAVATKLSPKIPSLEQAKELLKNAYYGNKPFISSEV
ncbi:iron-containing alcohol dehydrogenase [Natronincola ferrireducens]|uniref:Alcohol dehydrogenase, class IV n=1 Tax=Natronincola ferrireducens TaxID=393762 RepID=A0A1G9J6B7_9FIRM|nr:iron-containing alcohol dehydrogenase [Natronincola ferrireducens]SDL33060.1 Alcohol dehydrogenase, class IV [Natronincola ferrireducens]